MNNYLDYPNMSEDSEQRSFPKTSQVAESHVLKRWFGLLPTHHLPSGKLTKYSEA